MPCGWTQITMLKFFAARPTNMHRFAHGPRKFGRRNRHIGPIFAPKTTPNKGGHNLNLFIFHPQRLGNFAAGQGRHLGRYPNPRLIRLHIRQGGLWLKLPMRGKWAAITCFDHAPGIPSRSRGRAGTQRPCAFLLNRHQITLAYFKQGIHITLLPRF